MMRLRNVFTVPARSLFLSLLLSCNEEIALQVTEEATLYSDSMLSPAVLPDYKPTTVEQGFPQPVYPMLLLSTLDEPCWECEDGHGQDSMKNKDVNR